MFDSEKVLLIGPRFSHDGRVGGITVLFENLLQNMTQRANVTVVDSNAINHSGKVGKFLFIIYKVLHLNSYRHVALNGTAQDYLIIGPFLVLVSKLFSKSYSLRKFAGNFDQYYMQLGPIRRAILNSVLKNSAVNYFETKALVKYFQDKNKNTYWFPNVRPVQNLKAKKYKEGDVFHILFLSQLMKEKGIERLIEAVKSLDNVKLNIAGPIVDSELDYVKDYNDEKIQYLGVVNSDEVYKVMRDNHCLALPTFYHGEGYPGVIIEAFMIGLPVLVTNWNALPELVDSHGVIIKNSESDNVRNGIEELISRHEHYAALSIARSRVFNDCENTNRYLEKIMELAK